jgi:ribose transport system substrate-binding protein
LRSADEGYTIGISVLNLTGQFFIQLVDAAQNEADATGCTLMTNSCDSDSAKQITALENFISAGCDAIIVCAVDSEAAKPVIAKAKEEGIAVVCLTSTIDGYDAYIGCEEYVLGYTQGCAVGQRIAEMYGTDEEVQAATLNYDLMESVIAPELIRPVSTIPAIEARKALIPYKEITILFTETPASFAASTFPPIAYM